MPTSIPSWIAPTLALFAVSWPLASLAATPAQQEQRERERWQGAWVIRDAEYPGSVQAWNVGQGEVTIYDPARGTTEKELFRVVSPCRISLTRILPNGSRLETSDTFVFTRDELHVVPAPAEGGLRGGGVVTACIGDDVYTYGMEGGECHKWNATMTSPAMQTGAECRIAQEGPATYFVLDAYGGGNPIRVGIYGNALLSDPLLAHVAEREPSFADAVRRTKKMRSESSTAIPR